LIARAWFQRFKLIYDEPLSNFAFNLELRHYAAVLTGLSPAVESLPLALHSPQLLTVCLPGVALGVALALAARKVKDGWW